jgi:rhodanese-related sulfurtransferase
LTVPLDKKDAAQMEDFGFDTTFIAFVVILTFVSMRLMPRLIARVPFLDPRDAKRRIDGGEVEVVIDVRFPSEFNGRSGHIPGALNLPLAELSAKLRETAAELEPLKEVPVFVMCKTDSRAAHAVRYLKKVGFTNLSIIKGGIKGWDRAGLPVEKTSV